MSLGDDLLLLSIDPRHGGIRADNRIGHTLRAAELTDLILAGCVAVDQNRIRVTGGEAPDAQLAKALITLEDAAHEPSVKRWLLDSPHSITREHLTALRAAGEVAYDSRSKLSVHMVRLTPVGEERHAVLRERIDDIAHGRDAAPDERDLALAGLVHACGLGERFYSGIRGRGARKRLAACIDVRTAETVAGPAREADRRLADEISQALSNGIATVVREVHQDWERSHGHSQGWPTWDTGGGYDVGGAGGGGYDGGGGGYGGGTSSGGDLSAF